MHLIYDKRGETIQGEKTVSSIRVQEKLDNCMSNNEIRILLKAIHKINSKWINYLTYMSDTAELLEPNIEHSLT